MARDKKWQGLSYHEAIKFHGHNGPFLALGFRIGEAARQVLKSAGFMDLEAIVRIKREKPFTCIVDGISCAAGTTMGKGNLILRKGDGVVTFKDRKTGKTVSFVIKEEIIKKCLASRNLFKDARWILNARPEDLWSYK